MPDKTLVDPQLIGYLFEWRYRYYSGNIIHWKMTNRHAREPVDRSEFCFTLEYQYSSGLTYLYSSGHIGRGKCTAHAMRDQSTPGHLYTWASIPVHTVGA